MDNIELVSDNDIAIAAAAFQDKKNIKRKAVLSNYTAAVLAGVHTMEWIRDRCEMGMPPWPVETLAQGAYERECLSLSVKGRGLELFGKTITKRIPDPVADKEVD